MRRLLVIGAALAVVALLLVGAPASGPASASVNKVEHIHDNYYHPLGAFDFGSGTDHAIAQANCQGANPTSNCDTTIVAGDSVTWVTANPAVIRSHSVTECTDNTFSTCGPAVSATNPINDSGIYPPSVWTYGPITFGQPGTYYYRCEIHPSTMRGRVIVTANTAVGGLVDVEVGGSSGGYVWWLAAGAAGILAASAAGGLWLRRRASATADRD